MRKWMISLLASAIILTNITGGVPSEAAGAVQITENSGSWKGDGTEEKPFELYDQADLEMLRVSVEDGCSFEGNYFKMMNDISLDENWESIGGGTKAGNGVNLKPFSGTFDGDGRKLCYAEDTDQPLFRYVREATVQNLDIYAPYLKNCGLVSGYCVDYGEDGSYYEGTGGSYAPGCPDTIDIIGCTIKKGSVIEDAGLIAGSNSNYASGGNTVNIIDCVVEEEVKIGWSKTTQQSVGNFCIGSFAGALNGTISNCISYAEVYGSDNVGGLAAVKGQSMGECLVKDSAFCGKVMATGQNVGGILASGYVSDSAPNTVCVSIQNCYVDGSVSGNDYIGGILGREGAKQNWNASYLTDNLFYGNVEASEEAHMTGAIIGNMQSMNANDIIQNNYYLSVNQELQGIGAVQYIDTSAKQHEDVSGAIYFNTAEVLPEIAGISKENMNREDDPFGADMEKLVLAVTAEEMKDGTVTNKLNASGTSSKNWVSGSLHPEFFSKPASEPSITEIPVTESPVTITPTETPKVDNNPKSGKTVPAQVKIKKVKAKKKAAILKWKKIKNASGYVVYRSAKKHGKYKVVKTIKKGTTVTYTNKKLKSKKIYYYKVRAYRKANGKKVFGKYSAVKKVRTK